ncbi:MAG: M15 family metallopeptidase [Clostridium sp.]
MKSKKKKYLFKKKRTRREIMRFRRIRTYTVLFILFLVLTKWVVSKIDNKEISNEGIKEINTQVKEDISEGKTIDKSKIPVVNKEIGLNDNFIPQNLIKVKVTMRNNITPEETLLQKEAALELEKMFNDAKADGIILYASSGYRSYQTQKKLYEDNIKNNGINHAEAYVAEPGTSEHQLGLAMDVATSSLALTESFDSTEEGKWIKENSYKYGFIIRYPKGKEKITGYSYEPWHIRFVGLDLAKIINEKNITLEEYLGY